MQYTMNESMQMVTGATRAERRRAARARVKVRKDPTYPIRSFVPASLSNRAPRWEGKPMITFLTDPIV